MKTILTLIHDDPGLDSRLQVALDVTRSLKASLLCLDLTIPIVTIGADPLFGAMLLEPEARGEAQGRAQSRVEQSGLPHRRVERRGELGHEIADLAALADLVVLSSSRDLPFPDMHSAIDRLLVKARKPVIAVPAGVTGMRVNGEALLLWDGSEPARDAMAAAMPLFRHAAKVTILEVDDGSLGLPAIHASDYLTQRGIPNAVRTVQAFGEKASVQILEQIDLLAPDYVVMGGFGHARLVEALFGGVTECLLRNSPAPLFLKN